jgi:hypothetical protein
MKWNIHIYDQRNKEVRTEILDFPETTSRADMRYVVCKSSQLLGVKDEYILAVPYVKERGA